ncbi:lectin [Mycobacterium intermedium]|uniref:Lectin n=1 Tax=Mycobacterium intermedium TaxID=28445 RepID=A0A1E3SNR6_MYCIE|nr:LysM peptidoglycan-binding domain-containing protein [Mycobacterium intermedium]MCV6964658.1 LysM peptidoglycan-binding domain-containing protein [Mycobacterium intermedium]ODR03158.1 lectin [Mycobacterium intermedium]OPE45422.1 lectin [Mycobacterium intermedium]ORB05562.1 lectin [Mycobacterium intermedium]
MADRLLEGQKLVRGESLVSSNGAYTLTLQDDGNLVLASRGKPIWATGTNGQDVVRAEVQPDGNFVLYTPDKPVWHSDTKGKKNVALILQDDRNLVLYSASGPAWSTKTETDAPPPPEEPLADKSASEPAAADAGVDSWAASKQQASEAAEAAPVAEQVSEAPAEPVQPEARTYTVVSGDTLWAISERFYGDGSKYQVIADASGVPNPDLIYPGQVLTIP